MTSHELADMIYSVKEKLTDKEFKDIMEKLSIKKKEEEDVYEFKYIKTTTHMCEIGCECCVGEKIGWKFRQKVKTRKVKISKHERWIALERIMKDINSDNGHLYDDLMIDKIGNEYYLDFYDSECDISVFKNPILEFFIKDEKQLENTEVHIKYSPITPISLKKV